MNSYPQKPVARPKNVSQGGCSVNRLLGLMLLLICAAGLSLKANAQTWKANNDGKDATIVAESCLPANGYIDPGETNTVSFVVKNNSGADRAEVKVTLLEQGGVTFPSGEVNVGSVAKDATFTVSFSFRADGSCGGALTPTLHIVSKDIGSQDISYVPFQLGATVKTTTNFGPSGGITINDFNSDSAKLGRATPYPSSITVSGLPKADTGETVDNVTVTLNNLTHGYSQDIQVLLVAPNGTKIPLMGSAGGSQAGTTAPINGITVTFDQTASGKISQNAGSITSGTYQPSDYNATAYNFPDVGAGNATSLAALNGVSDPNGAWKLYVVDASAGDAGVVAGGWNLAVRTTKISCCGAGQTFPFVSRIGDATVLEDLDGGQNVVIATFNVKDLDNSDASQLSVSATSADQSKVTDANLIVEGTGNTRTLKIKNLVANANGTDTITVVVTDPQGHTSTSSFNLHITPVNDAPTISSILGQKVTRGTATGPIGFTVGDVETLPENLLVLAATSDATVVPVQNIIVSGTGANRTVNVLPLDANTSGQATITLTVRDAGDGTNPFKETSTSFLVNFGATPGNPTITPITAKSVDENGTVTIPFNVRSGLASVSPDALTITTASGNTTILPLSGIVIAGSGIDRTVTLTPAVNQNGQVSVTLTVSNGGLTDVTTFPLTVNPKNSAPTITSVGPQVTNEDTTSGDIVFTVGDVETAAANLNVTVSSDNPGLIPVNINGADVLTTGGYLLTANNATRTLKIRPAPNQFGKANVTVTVTDTGDNGDAPKSTSTTFVLTVNSVNDAPTITAVGNDAGNLVAWGANDPVLNIPEDSGSTVDATKGQRTIVLSGISPGPANENSQTVTVSASSSNPDVLSIVKVDPASVSGANANTTLTVLLGKDKFTAPASPVEITLTLTDNGGTDLGGVNTTTKKFKVNVTPVNQAPVLALPTLAAPLPGQTLSELNVAKNRSFTLPITLSDVETPNSLINMTASVSNDPENVFPPGSILFDLARTIVTFLPVKTPSTLPYTVTVTITATDNGATNNGDNPLSVTRTFKVTIRDIEPPTISAPSTDLAVDEDNVASSTITLTDNHPVSNLTLSVKSDNEVLIPAANVLFGPLSNPSGLSSTRAVAMVPAPFQSGVANVTITVKDDETLQAQLTYKVTVRAVNHAPTITLRGIIAPTIDAGGIAQPATIAILEDKATTDSSTDSKLLELDIADAPNETPVNQLVISKDSSNKDLVPVDNIVISGTGSRRTVTITPLPNKNGSTVITLSVTDTTGLSSSAKFTLNVTAVNDAPTIDQVSNLTLSENAAEQTINLTGITVGPDSGQAITSVTASAKDKGSDPAVNHILDITAQPGLPDSNGKTSFKIRPRQFQNGTSVVTVTVQDNGGTANGGSDTKSMSFEVAVQGVNQLPTISFDPTVATASLDRTLEPGASTGVLPFYISDVETAPEKLTVTATSSNPGLIPNDAAHLQLGGSFGTRGLLIQPLAGQSGTSTVVITVTDANGGVKTAQVNVTVKAGQNPTIVLTPSSQSIRANQFSDLIQINVSDAQTAADQLKTGYQDAGLVTSDNPALVPASPSNIQFGGTGGSRAMIILPVANQTGTANIRVGVKDSDGNTTFATFTLKVLGEAPTISTPTPSTVSADANKTSPAVSVTVGDKETFPGFLTVTGKSSDTSIIPDSNIFILGNNTSRSVTVLSGSKGGSATITLTVTDGEGQTATSSFVVNVNDSNTAPTITDIAPQTTQVNKPTGLINFVVGDKETAAASLNVTTSSGNTTLVPNSAITSITSSSNPASRSLVITPAKDQVGVALITVTVTDGGGKASSKSFALSVSKNVVANDFNGDGSQDIILQDAAGFVSAWFMSGDDVLSTSFLTPNNVNDLGWKAIGAGDFNGDGKTDLLFQHTDGTLAVWFLDGVTLTSSAFLNPANSGGSAWKAVATGDFNKDGKVDILFQHTDGSLAIWYMDGVNLTSVASLKPGNAGPGWTAFGTGDMNGDGNLDILFQHTDGTLAVWYLIGGNNLLLPALLSPSSPGDANWRAVGTIDLNGDGKTDLLLQNRANNNIAVWYMNGPSLILGKALNPSNPGGTWRVVAP